MGESRGGEGRRAAPTSVWEQIIAEYIADKLARGCERILIRQNVEGVYSVQVFIENGRYADESFQLDTRDREAGGQSAERSPNSGDGA